MKVKIIAILILMLLIFTLIPLSTTADKPIRKTIYVDDEGGADYTKIQDAIDNSSDNDTVYVYSGLYYENIIIDVSINLEGENKDTTIIEADDNSKRVVEVTADLVTISGFTIQKGGGMEILSRENTIEGNNIKYSISQGLKLKYSSGNNIFNNIITNNNMDGIYISGGNYNDIEGNTISNNKHTGIDLSGSYNSYIFRNTISSNTGNGIALGGGSDGHSIKENNITDNKKKSIHVFALSDKNAIYHNNFIDNYESAFDSEYNDGNNVWDDGKFGNYWSDYTEKYPDAKPDFRKPWMWDTPYELEGGSNKDNCPLINQWPETHSRNHLMKRVTLGQFFMQLLEGFPYLFPILGNLICNSYLLKV